MRHLASVLLVASSLLVLSACNKPADQAPLPPAGLAGAGGGGGGGGTAGAGGVGLPGAGSPITNPAGANPSLPAGHPPIGGVPPGTPQGMPMDHSNQPTPPAGGAVALPGGGSAGTAPPSGTVQIVGTVQEALNVPEYTYARVKPASGPDEWIAVPRTNIAVGDKVTVNQSIVMNNFPSKSLNRTFDKLTMGTLVGAPQKPN